MNFKKFTRLLWAYKWVLLLFPTALAGAVFYLTKMEERSFTTSTVIYTGFASGYTIEMDSRRDFVSINNAFDNLINTIKARTTLEEIGIRLLAHHLMINKPTPGVATAGTFKKLRDVVPETVIRQVVDPSSVENTVQNIYRYAQIPKNVIGEKLLNDKKSIYGVQGILSKLTVTREGNSDMIRLTYTADDPSVVKETIELVSTVFMKRYREIKVDETGNVVEYFMEQLKKASTKLSAAENKLTDFSRDNRIINYYEQTKSFTIRDKDFSLDIDKEKSNLAANKATLKDLEKKLSIRQDIALQSQQLTNIRDSLAVLNTRLAMMEMKVGSGSSQKQQLKDRIEQLEKQAKDNISGLYDINNSVKGLPSKLLFDEWTQTFMNVDQGEARLLTYYDIQRDYDDFYRRFAPLGSKMGQLERAISVAEREYLEILHGLSVSKLREQNMLMSSNLKIVDPPIFPGKPEPSKRLILVIGSFVAGLVLIIAYIIGKEYFDNSLKNPVRASKQVNIPFVGVLPIRNRLHSRKEFERLESIAMNQCLAQMALLTKKSDRSPYSGSGRERSKRSGQKLFY
ncbi:GumC family protein [Spirosoma foliorum]|uniref:Lipopolysaccharide biosynthesis protein n=1 Tax=Spirosoma foliorum TaxID=2710596 RepID=A0A7G5H3Z8_9BACT|nr:hypothetical protein [Spirosoma foliorum]QMW05840.1 hypothetical protein H3H32_13550 [Spirosoma foliorum]